jgi:hypothetical protein
LPETTISKTVQSATLDANLDQPACLLVNTEDRIFDETAFDKKITFSDEAAAEASANPGASMIDIDF